MPGDSKLRFAQYGYITSVPEAPADTCRVSFAGLTPPDMEVEVSAGILRSAGIEVKQHAGFLAIVSLDAHVPEDIKPVRFQRLPEAG